MGELTAWRTAGALGCLVLALVACGDGDKVAGGGADPDVAGADAGPDSALDAAADAPETAAASGIGKACVGSTDCLSLGLKCFETNPATGAGVCSKGCAGASDCPAAHFCNPVGGKLICTGPRYCDACATADECGPDAPLCLPDKNGKGFCANKCNVGDTSCGIGSSCKQYGLGIKDFACKPDYGACSGGGEHCSPCKVQADCAAGNQCYTAKSGERFCAQQCDPAKAAPAGCPSGFVCKAESGKGFCFKQVKEELVATCAKGDKGYCDACTVGYECASGRCASKNGKKFCVQPQPCKGNADCPYGGEATFCVPSDVGQICAPPPSWHCQGYKACLGHSCASNQTCDNGICK